VMAGEGPRHSHGRGVGGIVYTRGTPGHTDFCGTHKSDSPVRASNPPRSWTGTVSSSLPGFTIAPCVDSLLCYRIDQEA
jgi:hypothetical protein